MASYDKEKLLRLISQRRAAHLALIDLRERFEDARREMHHLEGSLRHGIGDYRLPPGFLAELLKKSATEVAAMSTDDIQGYRRKHADGSVTIIQTGINAQTYRRYIAARERAKRLGAARDEAGNEFQCRYGVVPKLIEAVRAWGFGDPELEV